MAQVIIRQILSIAAQNLATLYVAAEKGQLSCGQLGTASSPPLSLHCQVACANSPLPSHSRTTQHGQFSAWTTDCGQPKGEPGERVAGQNAE